MKEFSEAEAQKNFSQILALAVKEEVVIRRKDGSLFSLCPKERERLSPFDIPGIETKADTGDILRAIREVRERDIEPNSG